jgi:hypothetical protein
MNSPNICLFCRVVDRLVGQEKNKRKSKQLLKFRRIMQSSREKREGKKMAQLSDQ